MIAATLPAYEPARLLSLNALQILYTPQEERYDVITRIATRAFGVKMALVSLVGECTQWFKSAQGLDETETSRDCSFCAHAILSEGPFVIENTLQDTRFVDNPLVTGPIGVRFYAGYPVKTPDGMPVGTLCILDREPRHFSDADRELLRDLASLVEREFKRSG